jgi:uncharacterized protein
VKRRMKFLNNVPGGLVFALVTAIAASAQTPPTPVELSAYADLHKSASEGDLAALNTMMSSGADVNARDAMGRTAFHVAAYQRHIAVMQALAGKGADVNALESQAYDAVTIAAVADDVETLKVALALGNKATNVTSPYDGTALIAAAHLGHDEFVSLLIEANAPLNHVNNLGWTALIEAVILGDGGLRHQKTVAHLVKAGADRSLADRGGRTPLDHARQRGYSDIEKLLLQ